MVRETNLWKEGGLLKFIGQKVEDQFPLENELEDARKEGRKEESD